MKRNREKLLKMDDERKGRGEGERKEGGGEGVGKGGKRRWGDECNSAAASVCAPRAHGILRFTEPC